MTEQEAAETSLQVEAEGETVGEAKWSAVRELERRFPGIDKANVRFVVLSEGERGLLGVGFTPARVIASVSGPMASPAAAEEPGSPAALLRELLERVASCRPGGRRRADERGRTQDGPPSAPGARGRRDDE